MLPTPSHRAASAVKGKGSAGLVRRRRKTGTLYVIVNLSLLQVYEVNNKRKDFSKHPFKKNPMFIINYLFLIFCIFMVVFSVILESTYLVVFYLLFMLYCVYRIFFSDKVLFSRAFKNLTISQGSYEWERTVQFGDSIVSIDGNITIKYQWNQVVKLMENEDYLFLEIKTGYGIRLDKNGFTVGSIDEFINFIKSEQNIFFKHK